MNNNAPFIREIIDRTQRINGERVRADNPENIKNHVQQILKQQQVGWALAHQILQCY